MFLSYTIDKVNVQKTGVALALKLIGIKRVNTKIQMATLSKTYPEQAVKTMNRFLLLRQKYNLIMKQLDFSYFAFTSFVIAFSACLGGVLVKFSLQYSSSYWQFVLGMCLSLANIVACVAQFSARWIFNIFITTSLANIILILFSILL